MDSLVSYVARVVATHELDCSVQSATVQLIHKNHRSS